MDNSPEKYVDRLNECLAKKYKLLAQMLSLTESQTKALEEGNIEALEALINDKQAAIDSIDRIDEQFETYFQRLKQELKVKSLEELKGAGIKGSKELQELTSKVMSLISQISKLEKENNDKANRVLNSMKKEIKQISQGKKMRSAYSPVPPQTPSYFIDKKK